MDCEMTTIALLHEQIDKLADTFAEETIQIRRALHKIPEPGYEEFKTAAFIEEYLRQFDLAVTTGIAKTGITALLDTKRSGPTVMLRADMDALPIQEDWNNAYASEHKGYMHACGHDGHMAILLASINIFTQLSEHLCGRILFVFQPAEEGGGGARQMVETGLLEKYSVECCIAAHIWPPLSSGKVGVRCGPTMGAMSRFKFTIHGKGGHAAAPHESIDALDTGIQLVNALQRIVSRHINPFTPTVVSVSQFNAGTAPNILPETAEIAGTLRTFDTEIRASWEQRLHTIAKGVCDSMGAAYTLEYSERYPPVVNDRTICSFVQRAAEGTIGEENVVEIEPTLGSEDISFFFNKVPGCYYFLGAGDSSKEYTGQLHSPHFVLDESILPIGVKVLCRAACGLLSK